MISVVPQASQRLKKEILDFFIRLGIDIKRCLVLNSRFIRAIKFIESGKQVKAYDLYKQIISLLKTLPKKRMFNIGTHYKDTVNIREQHAACQKKEEELSKTISALTGQKLEVEKSMEEIGTKMKSCQQKLINTNEKFKEVIGACCKKCKRKRCISDMEVKLKEGGSQSIYSSKFFY